MVMFLLWLLDLAYKYVEECILNYMGYQKKSGVLEVTLCDGESYITTFTAIQYMINSQQSESCKLWRVDFRNSF